jgi:hypothetical protein
MLPPVATLAQPISALTCRRGLGQRWGQAARRWRLAEEYGFDHAICDLSLL